jgi:hypothetical protein
MSDEVMFERRLEVAMRRYADEAPVDVNARAIASMVTAAYPRRHGFGAVVDLVARQRRLLLVAALLVALLVGALILAGELRRDVRPFEPVPVVAIGVGELTGLHADRAGNIWSAGANGLIRYRPSDRNVKVYGPETDAMFTRVTHVRGATPGGIWFVDPDGPVVWRFAEERLVESVALPAGGYENLCELDDVGRLLALACDGVLRHWDGQAWQDLTEPLPAEIASGTFAIDPAGTVWLFAYPVDPNGVPGAWRHDASGWRPVDATGIPDGTLNIYATRDGEIWVSGGALATLGEGSWELVPPEDHGMAGGHWLAVAPDGTLWGSGENLDGKVGVFHRDADGRFTRYEVPTPESAYGTGPTLAVTSETVVVTAWGNLAQLEGDRFVTVFEGHDKRLHEMRSIGVSSDGDVLTIAGERDSSEGLTFGRIDDDAYDRTAPTNGTALMRALDGRLWMMTVGGPMRQVVGERFEPVADIRTFVASTTFRDGLPPYAVAADGTPFVVFGTICEDPFSPCVSDNEFISRPIDGAWTAIPGIHPDRASGISAIAIDAAGALWIATGREEGAAALARYNGDEWETTALPGEADRILAMEAHPDGSLWVTWRVREIQGERCFDCWEVGVGRLTPDGWSAVAEHVDGRPLRTSGRWVYGDLAIAPDGIVYASTSDGVVSWDGASWTWVVKGVEGLAHLAVAPDGTVWAAGTGVYRVTE